LTHLPIRHIISKKILNCLYARHLSVLCLLTIPLIPAFSQNNKVAAGDTAKMKYPLKDEVRFPFSNSGIYSPLYLNTPSNIRQTVTFDPSSQSYIFSEKMGSLNYRPPSSMSLQEYIDYDRKTAINNYWYQKASQKKGVQNASLLPSLKMGESFDKVFGTDVINIVPQGSAELIFGYNMSRIENPQLSKKNRRNPSFVFKEKIQMNVTGTIGDKMQLGINYNTESAFDFENKTKLEYTGKEDEIIKKVEAGNINFTVPNSTLITGSQSLFGLKTDMQFGKLYVSSVISHQKGQSQVINVKGGAQVTEFQVKASEYDAKRHFFLSHFFRDNYNDWLKDLPYVNSGVNIEKIEVWITNKTSSTTDTRNILAFQDLGESYGPDGTANYHANVNFIQPVNTINAPVSNDANGLYNSITETYSGIRTFKEIAALLAPLESSYHFYGGNDYEKIENARKLSSSEYILNSKLGYISLNNPLKSDEVLAVAYIYTYKGKTYYVGELSTSGVSSPKTLVLKLLKGTSLTPKSGTWDLMMKNVYAIGAYQVSRSDFKLDILYNKDETGVPANYIVDNQADTSFSRKILLKVFKLDQLDGQNEPHPNGIFDFIDGTTINAATGRVFFPQVEPFGKDLYETITHGDPSKASVAKRYVFQEIYDSTQTKARQLTKKDKYLISGSYKGSSGSEIQLNAMNVPEGSVKVSSGGITLVEGVDYSVDYALGRVKILNEGIIQSGSSLSISVENNALYNLQTKTLLGTHMDYKFSDNFLIGGTVLHLSETPLTQKVNLGDEPISNTILGLNTSYSTPSRFITKMLDKLPLIETKENSSLSVNAEVAKLIPGQSKVIDDVAYIDDFEGTETTVELKTPSAWFLSSAPRRFPNSGALNDLRYGYNRAKLAWYSIDPLFTRDGYSQTPDNIPDSIKNDQFVREILETEIYKNRQSGTGYENTLQVLNLAYYPEERGPYNFDPSINNDGTLSNPQNRWGGIQRSLQTTDFETANIGYIEFWVMDPFVKNHSASGGDLYFDLGEISEDVLKDSRKSFENGLPTKDSTNTVDSSSVWGRVPTVQSIVNAFDSDPNNRDMQDVGYDGLNDAHERFKFKSYLNSLNPGSVAYNKAIEDPAGDDFKYFLSPDYRDTTGVLPRYKDYNNPQGNSPTTEQSGDNYQASTTLPNTEDINSDNTLNETDSYFEYHIPLSPNTLPTETNNVTNKYVASYLRGKNGVIWYQFRIPIEDYESTFGNIEDFSSIRFMRMYLTGFRQPVILRMAELHLVRSEWRKYDGNIADGGVSLTDQSENGTLDLSSVNIEEDADKTPVNYVLPPGIDRVIDPNQPQVAELNEQSMVFKVQDLADGDARAAYKNAGLDVRQYKKLKLFIHAEEIEGKTLNDYDVNAFIRIGSDQTDNYYEYEVPLKLTPYGTYTDAQRREVWPDSNQINIVLNDFVDLKVARDDSIRKNGGLFSTTKVFRKRVGKNIMKIRGTPNLGNIQSIVIGVRNPDDADNAYHNDGRAKSVEVWFNELRLADFNNKGGYAARVQTQVRLADLGVVSVAGSISTPGFGSVEQKQNERKQEETKQINISSNLELGKLFPEKSKVSVPTYLAFSKTTITPEYSPNEPDRLMKDVLADAETKAEKKQIKENAQDVTKTKSINFTNVRVNKDFKKIKVLSPANFSVSAAYTETKAHSYEVERNNSIDYSLGFNYLYNAKPKSITPFAKSKILKTQSLRFLKDFNFTLLPSRLTYQTNLVRNYDETKLRNVYTDRNVLIDSTVSKNFLMNRSYGINWDLARSLKLEFSTIRQSHIDEMDGAYDLFRSGDKSEWLSSVWESMRHGGRVMNYKQTFTANYNLPISKLPLMGWTSATLRYNANYTWEQGPIYHGGDSLGNIISNTGMWQGNATLNFATLYGKSKYLKKLDQKYSGTVKKPLANQETKTVTYTRDNVILRSRLAKSIVHKLKTTNINVKVTDKQGKEIKTQVSVIDENKITIKADTNYSGLLVTVEGKVPLAPNPFVFLGENTIRFLTGLKNVSFSYSLNGTTIVEGFMPTPNFIGYSSGSQYQGAPGLAFLLGVQDENFVKRAAENGWITRNKAFNDPYTMTKTETFNVKGTFEPYKGFKIELTAQRSYNDVNSEYYRSDTVATYGGFNFSNHNLNGGFSISTITLGSAFEKLSSNDNYRSATFERFKKYREIISGRLGENRIRRSGIYYQGSAQQQVESGYSDGYGATSSEVLIPAFLAAYTGKDPEKVSLRTFSGFLSMLPNWNVTIDGLAKLPALRTYLKSITLRHSYKSMYYINSFNNNLSYFEDERDGIGYMRDLDNNFMPYLQLNTVTIKEDMNPLFSFDATWNNSLITQFELRRSRILALSLTNNQLTETKNKEMIIGGGYRFKDVRLQIKDKEYKSDLNLSLDISVKDYTTIIRYLAQSSSDETDQITAGVRIFAINFTADYLLSPRFNLQFYFDRTLNNPHTSASYLTVDTNIGFSLRFTLTQ
jgi:cell surface protein SprA